MLHIIKANINENDEKKHHKLALLVLNVFPRNLETVSKLKSIN